jgi:hypothetical protein
MPSFADCMRNATKANGGPLSDEEADALISR